MDGPHTSWKALDELGARQHGYVQVRQAEAVGVPRSTLWRMVVKYCPDSPHRGVIRLPGAPRTREGAIMAALLAVGEPALPWGWTAAWLWDLVPVLPTTIQVVIPHSRRAPALDRVRATRCRHMKALACDTVKGIPVPAPAPTICGVAGLATLPTLRAIVIDARQRRLARLEEVSECCDAISPFRGARQLRRILWELEAERCDSTLEWQLRAKLRAAGLRPDIKPAAVDTGSRTLHVDIPWSRQRVGIEVDGFGSHSSRASLNTDIRRHNRMQRTDWRILHAGWEQLDGGFNQLVDDLAWLLGPGSA